MPINNKPATVLGLFPEFGNGHVGGIQASACAGWQAIAAGSRTELVCYSRENGQGDGATESNNSRVRAMLSAISKKGPADLSLVWQMGLIKLLPFVRHESRRTALFLHGIESWREQDWLTRRLLRRVDLFLSNSDYTWARFLSYNPSLSSASHQTVPLGIETPLSGATPAPVSNPVALMLSRLSLRENYKGHREVIRAWPLVLERWPGAELWIAGDGDLRPVLERMADANQVAASVKFLGRVNHAQKQQMLEQSRCLLMPSRGEGFGLVYLEAMRVGRPCLVSTFDAGREVVNPPEAGLAVDPDNREALAGAIGRLLTDGPHWRRWSEQSRIRYEQNYTERHFQTRLVTTLFGQNYQRVEEISGP